MKKYFIPISLLFLIVQPLVVAQDVAQELVKELTKRNLAVVDQHIIPRYETLKTSTQKLQKKSQLFCQKPNSDNFVLLKKAFKASFAQWQLIQHIRFGPIENSLRNFRYQMWPDKRGKVNKHLNKLLISKKLEALMDDKFSHGSTAVQGFSALEMLLFNAKISEFDFSSHPHENYRCQVLQAITNNLATMSAGIVQQWSQGKEPFRHYIATAEKVNAFYESEREVGSALLNNLSTQLILIVDYKLDRPLGASIQKSIPKRAESWRSRQSLKNIIDNINSLHDLYQIGFSSKISNTKLNERIENNFSDILFTAKKINKPLYEAVKDPILRPKVLKLRQQIAQLKQLCSAELPKILDLPLGFNSLDGD